MTSVALALEDAAPARPPVDTEDVVPATQEPVWVGPLQEETTPDGYTVWYQEINSGCLYTDHLYTLDIPRDPNELSDISLSMTTWDVDYDSTACSGRPELDLAFMNGGYVGFLTGANSSWSSNSWPLLRSFLRSGSNTIRVDTDATGIGCWCVGIGRVEVKALVGFRVTDHTPAPDDRNRDFRAAEVDLSVTFSNPYDAATLTASTFKLEYRDASGSWQQVPGTFSQSSAQRFEFMPSSDLRDGIRYRVTVVGGASGVKSVAGGTLPADERWFFSTMPNLDPTLSDNFDYGDGAGSRCPPAVAPCPAFEVAVFQVGRNQDMVQGGKEAVARIYLRWRQHPDVLPADHVTSTIFKAEIEVDGNAYDATRSVRRPDRYTADNRASAINSINILHTPSSAFAYVVKVTPRPQTNITPRIFEWTGTLGDTGDSPTIDLDQYFLQDGAWSGGVPAAAQTEAQNFIRDGAQLVTDLFPTLSTTVTPMGNLPAIGYAYTGNTVPEGVCGNVQEVECPAGSGNNVAELRCVEAALNTARGTDTVVMGTVPSGLCPVATSFALGPVFVHQVGTGSNDGTFAHELGHVYGLSHDNNNDEVEGFQARTLDNHSFIESPTTAVSLMHEAWQASGTQWIRNDQYASLITTVNVTSQARSASAGGPYLYVSGFFDPIVSTGSLAFVFPQEARGVPPVSSSPCAVELLGAGGTVLSQELASFSRILHEPPAVWSGPQHFSASLLWDEAAQQLQVRCGGFVVLSRSRSASPPAVDFAGLPDGANLSGRQTLAWNGSDPDGRPLSYQLQLSEDGGATWSPLSPVSDRTSLEIDTAVLRSGADRRLRVLATDGFNASYAVRRVSLTNPLALRRSWPGNGATGVSAQTTAGAAFATEVSEPTLGGGGFVLLEGQSPVAGQVRYNAKARTATFTPATPLKSSTSYTARLASTVRDIHGNPLPAARQWAFTTAPDRTGPEVLSTSPAAGGRGIPLNALVQARFDEAMSAASLTPSTFQVLTGGGQAVPGSIATDAARRSVFFTPASPLLPNTEYTARLSADVADAAGNLLGQPYAWTFTTGTTGSPGVRIVGNYSDQVTDTNGDQLYDNLSITVDVEVLAAGSYNLNGRLVDSAGALIQWRTTGNVSLPRGVHTLTLVYSGAMIRNNGVDGPFTLDALSFYSVNNPVIRDMKFDAWRTGAYPASSFYSVLVLSKLPAQLLEWNTTREDAFNLRNYTTHATLPPTSITYRVVFNTDPRVAALIDSSANVDIRPLAGIEAESDVMIEARDPSGNRASSMLHVSVQQPRPSRIIAPAELTVDVGQALPIGVTVQDQWGRTLTTSTTVSFATTLGSVDPATVVTSTGAAGTVFTSGTTGIAFVTGTAGSATATTRVQVRPPQQAAGLYPIALHRDLVASAQPGDVLQGIRGGSEPGTFGWLTWTGAMGEPALARSLTPPGDSGTYSNPANPADHEVSAGDWVLGRPGVVRSDGVRDALDALRTRAITVPVWDESTGQGGRLQHRVSGYACIQVRDYQPSGGVLSVAFRGSGPCP